MTSPLSPEAVAQMVADMADGLDMAAEAEVLVIDGLEKYVTLFQADDRDTKTMRALRVYNEAKSNHRRFVNEACALRTLAAENATLRASEARLRASEAATAYSLSEVLGTYDEYKDMPVGSLLARHLEACKRAALTPTADKEPKT